MCEQLAAMMSEDDGGCKQNIVSQRLQPIGLYFDQSKYYQGGDGLEKVRGGIPPEKQAAARITSAW